MKGSFIAALGTALPWTLAMAQPPPRPPLRHEFIPQSFLERALRGGGEIRIEGSGPLPHSVRRDGARLPAPAGPPPKGAPVFGAAAGGSTEGDILRPSAMRPDRETRQDRALTYTATFNPSVAPLRRNVAFDHVAASYELTIGSAPLRPSPIAPRKVVPGRELFWGDVQVDAIAHRPLPIPSVAPDMRILALQTDPPVSAEILKDSADNFYVRFATRPRRAKAIRLKFLADADSGYFSGRVAGNVPLSVAAGHPGTALPAGARAKAERVLERLGVSPAAPFDQGLDRLVSYFRSFRAGPPPTGSPDTDIYQALALGGVGVCRHRAFSFLITARAAGVPTRYVQNEAHAFVEVLAPDRRWRRIDLGGQAPNLKIQGGQQRRLHTPPPDPYPKPASYLESYSHQLTTGEFTADQGAQRISGAPGALPSRRARHLGASPSPLSAPAPPRVPLPATTRASGAPPGSPRLAAGRPVQLTLDTAGPIEAYRGERLPIAISGRLVSAEGPLPGVAVQIYLVAPSGEARPIAPPLPTGDDGRFRARLTLPQTLPLGRYDLVAASARSERWAAGRSDADPRSPDPSAPPSSP